MDRVIITGVTGAIGIALINNCIEHGTEVIALVRPDSDRNDRIPVHKLVHIIECDLDEIWELSLFIGNESDDVSVPEDYCKLAELRKSWNALDDNMAFLHLGWSGTTGEARNDMLLQNSNVKYALDAVSLASVLGCKVFLGVGSQAEYGRVESILKPDTPVAPENGYGMAKLCAGQMTRILCRQLGMKHIWTRVLSVYGPYDNENSMIISSIRKLLKSEMPLFTAGNQKWDYIYCDDAAKIILRLADAAVDTDADGKIFCIGSGTAMQLRDYITELRDAINPYAELGIGKVPYAKNQVMHLQADVTDIEKYTGFTEYTSFESGVRKTINWCRETM